MKDFTVFALFFRLKQGKTILEPCFPDLSPFLFSSFVLNVTLKIKLWRTYHEHLGFRDVNETLELLDILWHVRNFWIYFILKQLFPISDEEFDYEGFLCLNRESASKLIDKQGRLEVFLKKLKILQVANLVLNYT